MLLTSWHSGKHAYVVCSIGYISLNLTYNMNVVIPHIFLLTFALTRASSGGILVMQHYMIAIAHTLYVMPIAVLTNKECLS